MPAQSEAKMSRAAESIMNTFDAISGIFPNATLHSLGCGLIYLFIYLFIMNSREFYNPIETNDHGGQKPGKMYPFVCCRNVKKDKRRKSEKILSPMISGCNMTT
jgi:hypothetical protein